MPVNVSPTPKLRVSHSVGVAEENEAGRHRPIDWPAHVDAILSTSGERANVWTAAWKMLPSVQDLLELTRDVHDLLGPFYFINLYPDAEDL